MSYLVHENKLGWTAYSIMINRLDIMYFDSSYNQYGISPYAVLQSTPNWMTISPLASPGPQTGKTTFEWQFSLGLRHAEARTNFEAAWQGLRTNTIMGEVTKHTMAMPNGNWCQEVGYTGSRKWRVSLKNSCDKIFDDDMMSVVEIHFTFTQVFLDSTIFLNLFYV